MVGGTVAILPDPASGGAAVDGALTADATDSGNLAVDDATPASRVDDHVRVLGREFNGRPLSRRIRSTIAPPVGATVTWATGTSITRLRPAGTARACGSANASSLYDGALLEFDNGTQKEIVVVDDRRRSGQRGLFRPALANVYNEGHKARVIEMEVATRYRRRTAASSPGDHAEPAAARRRTSRASS